jgi:protein involved in polysaccharide export with SLBB domain
MDVRRTGGWFSGFPVAIAIVVGVCWCAIASAQTPPPPPPDQPPPPLVIGRDPREPGEVISKQFLLKVWLSDVGGAGVQQIVAARVGADGNITLPGIAPQHAEGVTIGALEAQVAAPYKAASPNAKAWITIVDRNPPPAPTPAAATQPATQPAAKPAAATAPGK